MIKQYSLPKLQINSSNDTKQAAYESGSNDLCYDQFSVDLTALSTPWQQLLKAINTVEQSPFWLLHANFRFSVAVKDLLQTSLTNYEYSHPGYTLGYSINLRDKIIIDLIEQSHSQIHLSKKHIHKLVFIIQSCSRFNRFLRRPSQYPKESFPAIIQPILTNERIEQQILPILTEAERPLSFILENILPKNKKKMPNINIDNDNLVANFLLQLYPDSRERYYEKLILNFLQKMAYYIIEHPNINPNHRSHAHVVQLMQLAYRLLTETTEVVKPAFIRCLELFESGCKLDIGKGQLHNAIDTLKPPGFFASENPSLKLGQFNRCNQDLISTAFANYRKSESYHLLAESDEAPLDINNRIAANTQKIEQIPYQTVNNYCLERAFDDESQYSLLSIIKEWFCRLFKSTDNNSITKLKEAHSKHSDISSSSIINKI